MKEEAFKKRCDVANKLRAQLQRENMRNENTASSSSKTAISQKCTAKLPLFFLSYPDFHPEVSTTIPEMIWNCSLVFGDLFPRRHLRLTKESP